jgi:hypothetical protein
MAIQECDGITFAGTLNVTFSAPPDRSGVVHNPSQQGDWPHLYRYGITSTTPARLKIDPPEIRFNCTVTASGTGKVDDWEAGILQSISHAYWVAYYSNGTDLKYRVEGADRLVKDSNSAGDRFFRDGYPLRADSTAPFEFVRPDCPPVTFVTAYSGNLSNPHGSPQDQPGQLTRTAGAVYFRAFLAVINKKTGSILTLAESRWTLSRDGTYDSATKKWAPTAPDLITHHESDIANRYNPSEPAVCLPFRLDGEVANNRVQVWTSDGWTACQEGLPIS